MKPKDEKQVRYTLEDCLVNQRKLTELLKLVAQQNRELRSLIFNYLSYSLLKNILQLSQVI